MILNAASEPFVIRKAQTLPSECAASPVNKQYSFNQPTTTNFTLEMIVAYKPNHISTGETAAECHTR